MYAKDNKDNLEAPPQLEVNPAEAYQSEKEIAIYEAKNEMKEAADRSLNHQNSQLARNFDINNLEASIRNNILNNNNNVNNNVNIINDHQIAGNRNSIKIIPMSGENDVKNIQIISNPQYLTAQEMEHIHEYDPNKNKNSLFQGMLQQNANYDPQIKQSINLNPYTNQIQRQTQQYNAQMPVMSSNSQFYNGNNNNIAIVNSPYLNNGNGGAVLVNNQQPTVIIIKKEQMYPTLSLCSAICVLILNIFLPGVGTMIMGCLSNNPGSWVCIGFAQLALTIIIVGWIWSIVTGGICVYKSDGNKSKKNDGIEMKVINNNQI